jgi:ubiquitin carboxyl-terminal hydrolase 8
METCLILRLIRSECVLSRTSGSNFLQVAANILLQKTICIYASQFAGSDQHDSQEFLTFLLDGLHEDLNRVINKPLIEATPEREAELEKLPQQIASEQEWTTYRMRNDSPVVDTFQGQFRNRMECLTCHKVRMMCI